MKINLSKFAGFCDGVNRAYETVDRLDLERAKKPVLILGSLVHNDEVNRKIEKKGILRIDREFLFKARPYEIGTLIIAAHGIGPDVYREAENKNIEIIDTTCPKVTKVQRLAKTYFERGYKVIIVGDKDHKEVKGIDDWGGGESFLISEEYDLKNMNFDLNEKVVVLSQTTQNEDFFLEIGDRIEKKYKNAEIINTTCSTTCERQEEVKKLAKDSDVMIIIGSEKSANSKRLFEISKSSNPLSYFIEKSAFLDPVWFSDKKKVGVTAGASTPQWVINDVIKKLKKIEQVFR
jgi:(E)-4-hydroxy-3-methyl-but-2-enyl pyrophosphate reductase